MMNKFTVGYRYVPLSGAQLHPTSVLCSILSWGLAVINNHLVKITDQDVICIWLLQVAVRLVGKYKLGFQASEVSTRSVRPSTAMTLFLTSVYVVTIIMVGRWENAAIFCYIWEQVLKALAGLASVRGIERFLHGVPFSLAG